MARKGAFIVIEGLDGSGKSTQAKMLVAALEKSHKAVCTAEPSKGAIGRFIRNHVLYEKTRPPIEVEALLFAADRIDHIQREVAPALEEGKVVVSDRYLYSSLAYQGSAGLSLDWIQTINSHALKPELALLIDVAPEIVIARLKRKKSVMENLQIQLSVRDIYLKYVEKGELTRINGEKSKLEVAEDVLTVVSEFLKTLG